MTRQTRRGLWIVLLVTAALLPYAATGQSLKPRLDGELLHWSGANLRFLSSDAMQQLHDGATVSYAFRVNVSASRNGTVMSSISYHCVFSYDIWEEKYKVSRTEPGVRAVSHLSEQSAQEQCLDSLTIPVASLGTDSPFWIGIEYNMEDRKATSSEEARSILGTFVEVFSQKKGKPLAAGTLQGGPFRIAELRKPR